jgi:hypothetical protein
MWAKKELPDVSQKHSISNFNKLCERVYVVLRIHLWSYVYNTSLRMNMAANRICPKLLVEISHLEFQENLSKD